MSRNSSCLSVTNSVIGVLFAAASVTGKFIFLKKFSDNFTQKFFDIIADFFLCTGIAMSLFLIFGDPLPEYYNHQDTYDPNWEDIGKF